MNDSAAALCTASSIVGPAGFEGRRVLVVGVGNSGGEIASELANARARTSTVAVRSGANVVPLQIAGIPIQYLVVRDARACPMARAARSRSAMGKVTELRRGKPVLPKPAHGVLDSIPLIGFHLVDAIRAGASTCVRGVAAFTETGVRFTDGVEEPFDDVIFATGFTPALSPLGGLVRTDAKGFALRTDRVTSADQPHLYFVGHYVRRHGWSVQHPARRGAGGGADRGERQPAGRRRSRERSVPPDRACFRTHRSC